MVVVNSKFEQVDNQTQQKIGVIQLEKPVEVLFEGADPDIYKETKNISMDYSKSNFSNKGELQELNLAVDCNDGHSGKTT